MPFWNRKPVAVTPVYESWTLETAFTDGATFRVRSGYIGELTDRAELLAMADAMADGLRRAGFPADLTLETTTAVTR